MASRPSGVEWTSELIRLEIALWDRVNARLQESHALPLAFFIAGLSTRWKSFALTLVVIPLWTNLLIRTYAWQILLAPEGLVSKAAVALGVLHAGKGLYPGSVAVCIGMVCDYLPFLALPFVHGWTLALVLLSIVIAMGFHSGTAWVMRASPLYALTHPIGAAIFSYMLLRSTVVTLVQGGIIWRGTFYPLDELRRGIV